MTYRLTRRWTARRSSPARISSRPAPSPSRLAALRSALLRRTTGRLSGAGRAWCYPVAAAGLAALIGAGAAGCGSAAAPGQSAGSAATAHSGASSSPGGSSAAGHSGATISGDQAGTLCATRSTMTRLTVVRTAPPKVPPAATKRNSVRTVHFPFPARVTVVSPAKARTVATALCRLPVMPHGVIVCPAGFPGTTYRLSFAAAGRRLPVVTVQATACEVVRGAGPVRRASTSPGFWRVLGQAMDLYQARPTVFQGLGPTLHQCQVRTNAQTRLSGCPPLPRISAPVPVN